MILQALRQDLGVGGNGTELGDVQGRHSKGLGKAKFAVGLGVGVIRRAEEHIFALESPHAVQAFDAGSVECYFRYNDGSLKKRGYK